MPKEFTRLVNSDSMICTLCKADTETMTHSSSAMQGPRHHKTTVDEGNHADLQRIQSANRI